jgi:hypothetical protein
VVCTYCCEERPAKLSYFHSPEFEHIRVEACDTCQHYIKGVDLTRLGLAVPLAACYWPKRLRYLSDKMKALTISARQ